MEGFLGLGRGLLQSASGLHPRFRYGLVIPMQRLRFPADPQAGHMDDSPSTLKIDSLISQHVCD